MIRKVMLLVVCLALAAVFLWAAIPKILSPRPFALAIFRYQILPSSLINLAAIYMPWIELTSALGLLIPRFRRAGVILILLMLLGFTGAMASALWRGIDIACGCFSTSTEAHHLGWINLARNLGLMALAVAVLVLGRDRKQP